MKGHRIGYIRVSSYGQNEERQLDGVELDDVYKEKVSAKTVKRPVLQATLKYYTYNIVKHEDTIRININDKLFI